MHSAAAAGSRRKPPARLELQLARLVASAPEGQQWLHEVKFDGYRVLIWRSGAAVRITSRGSQDWTHKLSAAARAAQRLRCDNCLLDGELIAVDERGHSSFGDLQRCFGSASADARLRIMVFDLLWLDGADLRALPQAERKGRLARLMRGARPPLLLTAFTTGNGPAVERAACQHGLEGIVSKSADAPYGNGRTGAWLKAKCVQSDEYAVIGYTRGQGARQELGSLLLGDPGPAARWRYLGRVGTGFGASTLAELAKHFRQQPGPVPLANPPTRAQLRGAQPVWVRPTLVVEVEFRGLTSDGLLRQASLKGLRRDRTVASLRAAQRDKAPVATGVIGRRRS